MSIVISSGLALVLAGAAPERVLVLGAGDCRDRELIGHVRSLDEALRDSNPRQVLWPSHLRDRLGATAEATLEELQRRVEVARETFYRAEYGRVKVMTEEALLEIRRLPPGAERWSLAVAAEVLLAMASRRLGRELESKEAFRRIVRIDSDFQLDPDEYAPSTRADFARVRKQVASARKASLTIGSSPSGADVFVDGRRAGATPLTLPLLPGAYEVTVGREGRWSLPRAVPVASRESVHVDLAFEGKIHRGPPPCVEDSDDERERLSGAVRLAAIVGASQVAVLRLQRSDAGPRWLLAALLDVARAEKTREGGVRLKDGEAEAPSDLARFIITGERAARVRSLDELSAPPQPPKPSLEPVSSNLATPGRSDAAVPAPSESGSNLPRLGGYALLAGAATALATAVVVQETARPDAERLASLALVGALPENDDEALALHRSLEQRSGLATGLLVGAGVAAVAGGTLLFVAPTIDSDASVAPVVTPGGAALALRGTF